jgi:hypothetical protein
MHVNDVVGSSIVMLRSSEDFVPKLEFVNVVYRFVQYPVTQIKKEVLSNVQICRSSCWKPLGSQVLCGSAHRNFPGCLSRLDPLPNDERIVNLYSAISLRKEMRANC